MLRFNNWMSYSYDGIEHGQKKYNDSVFQFIFNNTNLLDISHKDALYRNARLMRDTFREPFDLCLSGGIDSEVMIRVFKDLKIKHNTFIFRYENDHNIKDVNHAIKLCDKLGIDFKIIDFELEKFFEHDAMYYAKKSKCYRAGRLPKLKWIESLDNIPVFGDGDPYWHRQLDDDYTKKSIWLYYFYEDAYVNSTYSNDIGKTAITEWYEFTPEVLMSHYKLPIIQELLNDNHQGKRSTYSSRAIIYKEIWPDIDYIPKMVGYEGMDKPPGSYPDFMINFQNNLINEFSNAQHKLTEEEFVSCLTIPQKF